MMFVADASGEHQDSCEWSFVIRESTVQRADKI